MISTLSWQIDGDSLSLQGKLTDDTFHLLWLWLQQTSPTFNVINVNQLSHVDSAGLSLIVYTLSQRHKNGQKVSLSGSNDKLKTLISLYNLDNVIMS